MTRTRPARRWLRGTAIGLALLVLALAAAWLTLVRMYPPARLAALLATEVLAATGRELRVGGELSIRLLPRIAVQATDVTLGNAAWSAQPVMARLDRASFEIALRPLLAGRISILQVQLQGADLLLESDAGGRVNWQLTPPAAGPAPGVTLDRLRAEAVRLRYRDGHDDRLHTLMIESLDLQAQGERDRLEAKLALDGVRWQVQAEVGRLFSLAGTGADWPFTLRASSGGATLSAEGRAGTGPGAGTLSATVRAQLDHPAALPALAPALTHLALPLVLEATVERSRDAWQAEPLRLSSAGQAIVGQLRLRADGPEPRLSGHLSAAALDLARLQAGAAPAPARPAGPAADGPLFGDHALPLAGLAALPAMDLDLRVESLRLPGVAPLTGFSARLATAPGRFALDRLSFATLGGQVNGRLATQIDARAGATASRPATTLQLDARDLSVDALTALHEGVSRLKGGRADLGAQLVMAGDTPRSLAATAQGEVLLQVTSTTLAATPAWLDRNPLAALLDALLPRRGAADPMAIGCIVLRLPLVQGKVPIDRSIALETDQLAVSASGELDLRAQTVALAFRPQAKRGLGLSPGSLAQLVTLQGPLQAPGVAIDPKGTAREAVTVGAAVASSGLTLLAGRMLQTPADSQACKTALAGRRLR